MGRTRSAAGLCAPIPAVRRLRVGSPWAPLRGRSGTRGGRRHTRGPRLRAGSESRAARGSLLAEFCRRAALPPAPDVGTGPSPAQPRFSASRSASSSSCCARPRSPCSTCCCAARPPGGGTAPRTPRPRRSACRATAASPTGRSVRGAAPSPRASASPSSVLTARIPAAAAQSSVPPLRRGLQLGADAGIAPGPGDRRAGVRAAHEPRPHRRLRGGRGHAEHRPRRVAHQRPAAAQEPALLLPAVPGHHLRHLGSQQEDEPREGRPDVPSAAQGAGDVPPPAALHADRGEDGVLRRRLPERDREEQVLRPPRLPPVAPLPSVRPRVPIPPLCPAG